MTRARIYQQIIGLVVFYTAISNVTQCYRIFSLDMRNEWRPRASHLQVHQSVGYSPSSATGTGSLATRPSRIRRRHANQDLSRNITAVLESLLQNYDNSVRPAVKKGPTVVKTNMLIRSLGPISELNMEYSMDCYFRQMWRDERLTFNSSIDQLSLSITMLEGIWKPDTYFVNGRGSYVHTITRPNKLIRLARDGSILYSMRLTIKAKCPMHLRRFPMDQQTCPLLIGSYAYNRDEVRYIWDEARNVSLVPGIHLSQFDLMSYPVRSATVLRKIGSQNSEHFSVLQVHFNLQRHTGYFLIQVYVPCILIVVLSWVSFWINREATADRVGLGITSVLTLSTISIDTRNSLPKVAYATAMDWFLLTSFGFIIATLLEFAAVHYFTKVGSGESLAYAMSRDDSRLTRDTHSDWLEPPSLGASRDQLRRQMCAPISTRSSSAQLSLARADCREDRHTSIDCDNQQPAIIYQPCAVGGLERYSAADREQCHDVGVEFVPPPPPPPPPPPRGASGYAQVDSSAEPCWYQVIHCLLGSVEYRLRRQVNASYINSVSRIDRASRLLFPLLFTVLNLFYWNWYWSDEQAHDQWSLSSL